MIYSCERCGKSFNTKYNLVQHLSRKTPCLATKQDVSQESCLNKLDSVKKVFTCETCSKCFTTKAKLTQHVENVCQQSQSKNSTINIVNNNTTNNITNNITNNTTNNNTININVNFAQGKRNFGSERVDYLSPVFIRECLEDFTQGIGKMVKQVYFNPKYPENHTVRVHSSKQKLMKIVCDGGVSLIPNKEAGIRATTKIGTVFRQQIEDMIGLLQKIVDHDYDEDYHKTFQDELKSAIDQLQWLREHTLALYNKDMTRTTYGRGYTRTCNMVAAHIIGMSKAEESGSIQQKESDSSEPSCTTCSPDEIIPPDYDTTTTQPWSRVLLEQPPRPYFSSNDESPTTTTSKS